MILVDYQSKKDGVRLNDSGRFARDCGFAGTQMPAMMIFGVQLADEGSYELEATLQTTGEKISSKPAWVSVIPQPLFPDPGVDTLRYKAGDEIRLRVVLPQPEEVVKCKWHHDGWAVDGGDGTELVIKPAKPDDEGMYSVSVYNNCDEKSHNVYYIIIGNQSLAGARGYESIPGAVESLEVQPNPATDAVEIRFVTGKRIPYKLSICDALGYERAILLEGITTVGINRVVANITSLNLDPEVYFLMLRTAGSLKVCKLLIINNNRIGFRGSRIRINRPQNPDPRTQKIGMSIAFQFNKL